MRKCGAELVQEWGMMVQDCGVVGQNGALAGRDWGQTLAKHQVFL